MQRPGSADPEPWSPKLPGPGRMTRCSHAGESSYWPPPTFAALPRARAHGPVTHAPLASRSSLANNDENPLAQSQPGYLPLTNALPTSSISRFSLGPALSAPHVPRPVRISYGAVSLSPSVLFSSPLSRSSRSSIPPPRRAILLLSSSHAGGRRQDGRMELGSQVRQL